MMALSTSGKSILKPPNPCSGKSYCEISSDYPAELIRNLLRNRKIPHGLFNGKFPQKEIKANSEILNNGISDLKMDIDETEMFDQVRGLKNIEEEAIKLKHSTGTIFNGIFSI